MADNPFDVLNSIDTTGYEERLQKLESQVNAFTRNYEEQMAVLQKSRDELKQMLQHLEKTLADISAQIQHLRSRVPEAKCLLSSIPPKIDDLHEKERRIQLKQREERVNHEGYMHLYHGIFEPEECKLKIDKLYEAIVSSETVHLREDIRQLEHKLHEYQTTIRDFDDLQKEYPVIESQIATVSRQLKDKEQEICKLSNYFTKCDKQIHFSYLMYALKNCVSIPGYSIQDDEFFEFFCCPDRQKALILACNLRHQDILLSRNEQLAAKIKKLTSDDYTTFYLCYMETTRRFNIHSKEPFIPLGF